MSVITTGPAELLITAAVSDVRISPCSVIVIGRAIGTVTEKIGASTVRSTGVICSPSAAITVIADKSIARAKKSEKNFVLFVFMVNYLLKIIILGFICRGDGVKAAPIELKVI